MKKLVTFEIPDYSKLKDGSILPSKNLQDKLDFYITPYNTSLSFHRFMEFNDEIEKEQHRIKALKYKPLSTSDQWKYMADFILNEHQNVFRRSCQNINRGLYLELKDLSKYIKEQNK